MRSLMDVTRDIEDAKKLYANSEDDSPGQDYAVYQLEQFRKEMQGIVKAMDNGEAVYVI